MKQRKYFDHKSVAGVMWSSLLLGVLLVTCEYVTAEYSSNMCHQNCMEAECQPSITTVSGTHAPKTICSGSLIFADEFEEFDFEKWQHEITLGGSGNWEFQYYNNNRTNSFTDDGILFIRPSLMSDQFGETFLVSGRLNIDGGAPADRCTNPQWYGCERTGTPANILNPIKSARIRSLNSFSFRYGRVEVRAKLPAGDWLWPDYIQFSIDDEVLGKVDPGKGGFWNYGGFDANRNILNPWRYGSKMAPFDQKFYLIINLAVGGTSGYFPDGAQNPSPKPWLNSSPKAANDFWDAKEAWLPTWGLDRDDGRNASLQVDYVRVWAL